MTGHAGDYGFVMTTVGDSDAATAIADALIEARLAACVQTIGIGSRYRWKGDVVAEPEVLLLIKTRTALFEDAIKTIRAIHPYETPEIVATPFAAGFAGYFSWIDEVTACAPAAKE